MGKVQELADEINRLKRQIEVLKNEGLQLLKEKETLQIANKNAQLRTENLEKELKKYEQVLK